MFAYQGRQQIMLIIGLAFLAIGSIAAYTFGSAVFVDLALDVAAEPCDAVVIGTELRSNAKVNGRHPTEIRFECTAGGVAVRGSCSTLNDGVIGRATPGARVQAEVLPSLSVGRVEGTTYSTIGYLGLLVFIFPLTGIALTLLAYLDNRGEIRAFVHGVAVRGRVVRREEDRSARKNRRHPWLVGWKFTVDGKRYEGFLTHMDKTELERAIPTNHVVVLYDPSRPETNTVYIA